MHVSSSASYPSLSFIELVNWYSHSFCCFRLRKSPTPMTDAHRPASESICYALTRCVIIHRSIWHSDDIPGYPHNNCITYIRRSAVSYPIHGPASVVTVRRTLSQKLSQTTWNSWSGLTAWPRYARLNTCRTRLHWLQLPCAPAHVTKLHSGDRVEINVGLNLIL